MWTVIITLILTGILLLMLEILVIPGTGLAGFIGFFAMASGIWFAYSREGTSAGNVTLVSTVVLNVVAVVVALRSKTWKKAQLQSAINSKAISDDAASLQPGQRGKTISRCAPMGKIFINGKYFEADAGTRYISQGEEIEIEKVEGKKIYIKPVKK